MERFSLLIIVLRLFTGRGGPARTPDLDRRDRRDHEIGPAFRATDLVVAIDVELVDVDIRIARGAAGHERYRGRIIAGSG